MKIRTFYGHGGVKVVPDNKNSVDESKTNSFEQNYKDFINELKNEIKDKEEQKVNNEKADQ